MIASAKIHVVDQQACGDISMPLYFRPHTIKGSYYFRPDPTHVAIQMKGKGPRFMPLWLMPLLLQDPNV